MSGTGIGIYLSFFCLSLLLLSAGCVDQHRVSAEIPPRMHFLDEDSLLLDWVVTPYAFDTITPNDFLTWLEEDINQDGGPRSVHVVIITEHDSSSARPSTPKAYRVADLNREEHTQFFEELEDVSGIHTTFSGCIGWLSEVVGLRYFVDTSSDRNNLYYVMCPHNYDTCDYRPVYGVSPAGADVSDRCQPESRQRVENESETIEISSQESTIALPLTQTNTPTD